MSKNRRTKPKTLWNAFVICLALLFPASQAKAMGADSACPAVWRDYIKSIGEIVAPLGPDFPLLFVNREGDVFDCLNLINDRDFIERATLLEKSLPIDRTSAFTTDPVTWPVNMCTGGSANFLNLVYFSIVLPNDAEILATDACWRRVMRSAEDLVTEGN